MRVNSQQVRIPQGQKQQKEQKSVSQIRMRRRLEKVAWKEGREEGQGRNKLFCEEGSIWQGRGKEEFSIFFQFKFLVWAIFFTRRPTSSYFIAGAKRVVRSFFFAHVEWTAPILWPPLLRPILQLCKGACTYDVRKIFRFLDPLPLVQMLLWLTV